MTCDRCASPATHVYDLDDHADEPNHYCAVHAPGLARKVGRISGVGKPGGTPPTGPAKSPAGDLNDLQVEALQLLAAGDVTGVRTHYRSTQRVVGPHGPVLDVNAQTLRALVRRGYVADDGACRVTPAGRAYLEAVRRG